MHTWSKMRYKLENEYLADSLKGHIRYFAASYNKCPDHCGRAAILLDGAEIIEGSYFEQWSNFSQMSEEEKQESKFIWERGWNIDNIDLKYGMFDQQCFYNAFMEFDNQSIEKSLESNNMLVRIFAVLDRRVGKRRLEKMKPDIEDQPEMFRKFYDIRVEAEKNKELEYDERSRENYRKYY